MIISLIPRFTNTFHHHRDKVVQWYLMTSHNIEFSKTQISENQARVHSTLILPLLNSGHPPLKLAIAIRIGLHALQLHALC